MLIIGQNQCVNVTAPMALSFTSASINCFLSITAVIGNLLVILAVTIDPNKNLYSPFNVLVANLALADLIVGCVVEPMSIDYHIREGLGLITEDSLRSEVRRVCYFISCTASLFSMAALTLDRYIAIAHPMKYRAHLSIKRTIQVSVLLWLVSFTFPFLYFAVGYLQYQFFFANTAVIATFAVMVFTYLKVYRRMRSQVNEWDKYHESTAENRAKRNAIKWEKKVTQTSMVVMGLFIACFLPSLVLIYTINFCNWCNCTFIHWARDLNYILILANSSINPYLFGWRLKTYRSAFFKILRCRTVMQRIRTVSDGLNAAVVAWPRGMVEISATSAPQNDETTPRKLCSH